MQIFMLGLDHRKAPVDVRGRAAFLLDDRAADFASLLRRPGLLEAVILSTCNRTELYVVGADPDSGPSALTQALVERKGLASDEIDRYFTCMFQEEAAGHLFRVAAGLESLILGEGQILSQVKEALASAQAHQACGAILDALFRRALSAGKRARTETGIAKGAVSVAGAAVELARDALGSFQGRSVLVLGTGKIGEVAARHLSAAGLSALYLANRTRESALELAGRVKGEAIAFHDLGSVLDRVDVLLCCTGAPHHVLEASDLIPVIERRRGKPLLLIDVSVPRNLDPRIARLEGCRLCDLDDLHEVAERNRGERASLLPAVEGILAAELAAFLAWRQSYQVAPTITSLRCKLAELREQELERFWARHGGRFSVEQRPLVGELIEGLFDKLLHAPFAHLKGMSGQEQQHVARALETLFELSVEDLAARHQRRLAERRNATPGC